MNKNQRTTLHTLSVLALAALMGACTSAPSQPAAPMPPTIAQHSTPDLASYDWNLTAAFDAQGQPDGRWLLDRIHPGAVHFDLEAPTGAPSRWNTLRALRVLKWWDDATLRSS